MAGRAACCKEGYGIVKCSLPKPPRAPLFFEQKVSRQVLSPTTGFPSPPHSTRSPQMCFVSRAIAPRLPWLESHLGHWYWDVPSYAHRYVEHRKSFDKSGEGPDAIWKQRATGPTFGVTLQTPSAVPRRAEPRDRTLSTGTSAPNRASRPACVL